MIYPYSFPLNKRFTLAIACNRLWPFKGLARYNRVFTGASKPVSNLLTTISISISVSPGSLNLSVTYVSYLSWSRNCSMIPFQYFRDSELDSLQTSSLSFLLSGGVKTTLEFIPMDGSVWVSKYFWYLMATSILGTANCAFAPVPFQFLV